MCFDVLHAKCLLAESHISNCNISVANEFYRVASTEDGFLEASMQSFMQDGSISDEEKKKCCSKDAFDSMCTKCCKYVGISLFTNYDTAIEVAKAKGSNRVLKFENIKFGTIRDTPSRNRASHCTWWLPMGFELKTLSYEEIRI